MLPIIFCPNCDTFIYNQANCPQCNWCSPIDDPTSGIEIWRTAVNKRLSKPYSYPVIAGENYCLISEVGTLVALNMELGQVVWERSLVLGEITRDLASDGVRIFISPTDTRPIPEAGKALLALDARTGAEVWHYATTAHSLSVAAVADSTLYFTTTDSQLHAVDTTTGEVRWVVDHVAWGPEAPAIGAGVVCVGGRGNTLVAYQAVDGARLWEFSADDRSAWFTTQPVVGDGWVYAWCWDTCLYALEIRTGQLAWTFKGERGNGITTPPVVANGRVFIGSRVYRQEGECSGDAYALLALDQKRGTEQWRYLVEQHILVPPSISQGVAFFCTEKAFYTLDSTRGMQRSCKLMSTRIITPPLVHGDIVMLADRYGTVSSVRWRTQPIALESPNIYKQRHEYDKAAVAHIMRSEFAKAAAIYKKLQMPRRAAQLYERARKLEDAAELWEQLAEFQHARDLYRDAGNRLKLAYVLAHLGEPLEAARLYEAAGSLGAAAPLYEQAGDRVHAAKLYQQIGQFQQARHIWESLGDWEQLVESLITEGRQTDAAQILEQRGQLERAAMLYESAGALRQALKARTILKHWERVVQLAVDIGEDEQAGIAYEQLDQPFCAAEVFERIAQRLKSNTPQDIDQIAIFYERAARLYSEADEGERVTNCRREVRRYRKLPDIVVHGIVQEAFVEYEWNTLQLRIENHGYGPAYKITIKLCGTFDIGCDYNLVRLFPEKAHTSSISVRPHREQYGPKVPLEIVVTYEDQRGDAYEAVQSLTIHVVQKGQFTRTMTPLEIRVGESLGTHSIQASPNVERQQLDVIPLTIRFLPHLHGAQVMWESDNIGQHISRFVPPYDATQLPLVIKALDAAQWPRHPVQGPKFSLAEQDVLSKCSLWCDDRVATDIHTRVGRALYKALVDDPVGERALYSVRNTATNQGLALSYILRFPPTSTDVAMLPWELLWDEHGTLLLSRRTLASCVRYLDIDQALPPIPRLSNKLRILAITPRAGILPSVHTAERRAFQAAWTDLTDAGIVELEELRPATPQALVNRVQSGPPIDVIHFYGHGRYRQGQGELQFDREDGTATWLDAGRLVSILSKARLIMLYACQSATMSDTGLLTGVASALSAIGVPAVVAMQMTIRTQSAIRFSEVVYRSLVRGHSLQQAVSQARQALYVEECDGASWYVPTVTIRGRTAEPLYL